MMRLGTSAVFLIALALGVLTACGDDPATPNVPSPTNGTGTADPDDPGGGTDDPFDIDLLDEEPRFATAAECGKCHVEIYQEWAQSYHGRAMSDPLFLEFSADINKEECIRCHAPVALRVAGFVTPIARTEHREDAVSCLTCHQSGGGVAGPHAGLSGACNPVHDPDQTDVVKMCFVCHNQHDTGNEWLRGPYSPNAPAPRSHAEKNCLDCHMEKVFRPLVPGGEKRWGRRHNWPGGHDPRHLRKAAKLHVDVTPLDAGGVRVKASVENVGAGHAIPTDARHRSFDTYVKIVEADGTVLLDPIDPLQQGRAHVGNYRLQYRNSGLKDTQVPPGETVSGLGEWKGYVDLPKATKGSGEIWLVYRLTPRDVLDERSFAIAKTTDLGNAQVAVVVSVLEFEYGE